MRNSILAMAAALLLAGPAAAEVVDAQANGFELRRTATIAAPPAKVYAALVDVGRWWSSAHSWSGDARNMTLVPQAGGCFCEKLPGGGSVLHMTVVYADPGKMLRLRGALGPLQGMGLEGVLTWSIKAVPEGSELVQGFSAGGYAKGGANILAVPVDGVLGEQLGRLKAYVETGRPGA
jgi:uncharacterized protein YndB with AHSA1/START domain